METVYHHADYSFMTNQLILNIKVEILYQMDHFQKFFLQHFVLDGLNVAHNLPVSLEFRKYICMLFYIFHFVQYILNIKFKYTNILKNY